MATLYEPALSLRDHMAILPVLLPLIGAPLIVMFGSRRTAFFIALTAFIGAFIACAVLLLELRTTAPIVYYLGGWAPPAGIEYRVDAASGLVAFLIATIGMLVLPYAQVSLKREVELRHHSLIYACLLLCFAGLMGMVLTGDAFNVFVFLEISSLSAYVLIAQGAGQDKRALTAAYDYLIMGTIGATFFIIGLAFLYASTGTLNLADLGERIAQNTGNRSLNAGFVFIFVGLGLKIAIYPLHLWLPRAYTFAPSAVSVFLASTATKAALYVLVRFFFSVFQIEFLEHFQIISITLGLVGIMAMFSASFIAVFQRNLKRMLVYSSIAQIGYMVLGVAMLSQTGLTATLVHIFNHGITKAVLFMGAGALFLRAGSVFYDNLAGLGRRMPLTMGAMVLGFLSLIGVPGTAGFISKWILVQAAFERGLWWVAVLILLSSLLAVIYCWRAVELLYFAPKENNKIINNNIKEAPLMMLIPMWILALACLWFGLDTDLTIGFAGEAARTLIGGG